MYVDNRGSIQSLKTDFPTKEMLVSKNYRNVWKGFHLSPYRKLVYVAKGRILDYFTDGTEFKRFELAAGDHVEIPAGWAHGYYCLEDSEVVYLLAGQFDPAVDRCIHWKSPEFQFDFPFTDPIVSDKDREAPWFRQCEYLVFGDGFLGNQFVKYHPNSVISRTRLDGDLESDIKKSGCRAVICAAGISGKPTIDWCEDHEEETFEANFLGALNIARVCKKLQVPLVYFGSGAVYTEGTWSETDPPNYEGTVYSKWRVRLEEALKFYPVTYLRIMYPCSFDGHPKSFDEKMKTRKAHKAMIQYTDIPSLFPLIPKLIGKSGIYNFVCETPVKLSTFAAEESDEAPNRPPALFDTKKLTAI